MKIIITATFETNDNLMKTTQTTNHLNLDKKVFMWECLDQLFKSMQYIPSEKKTLELTTNETVIGH